MWKVVLIYLVILLGLIGITNAKNIKVISLIDGTQYAYIYNAENLILQFDSIQCQTFVINIFSKVRWNNYLYISGDFKVKELIISFDENFQNTTVYIMQLPKILDIGVIIPRGTKIINKTGKRIKILYY